MKDNELVRNFRDNKMEVELSRYSFELLLSFLHERKFLLLLSIINVRLNVKGRKHSSFGNELAYPDSVARHSEQRGPSLCPARD